MVQSRQIKKADLRRAHWATVFCESQSTVWKARMEPKKNPHEETVEELSKRIDSEQDLEKILDLVSKTQQLQKKPLPK